MESTPKLNRHQRRAQYAVPSRSKPYTKRSRREAERALKGHAKLLRFIDRGLSLGRKPNS